MPDYGEEGNGENLDANPCCGFARGGFYKRLILLNFAIYFNAVLRFESRLLGCGLGRGQGLA